MAQLATFGAGCFWCVEAVFDQLRGVQSVQPGYCNGATDNPTYEQVCTGLTGFAEVIQISFDAEQITYRELLTAFFSAHDPTQLNRQGNDVGTQYRSGIYYHDETQRQTAHDVLRETDDSNLWTSPIVTEIQPLDHFFPAELYHHQYFSTNPGQPYCATVIAPKITKFRTNHPELFEEST
ncbi:MAG: peptide-methionine (S)-S-oxide reductase MsrA [Planctomycetota bacterium]|nr:peptide-methionine (S)-S-oxide reductase MsrA [Planctomycetota bacterium]